MRSHADDLRAEVADPTLADAVVSDWQNAPLDRISPRARALCEHAVKLTRNPGGITQDDVDRLRQAARRLMRDGRNLL